MILNFWASFCLYFPGPRVRDMYVCSRSDRDWIQGFMCVRHALCQPSCASSCRCPASYHLFLMAFICPVCHLPPQQSGPKLSRSKLFYSQRLTERNTLAHFSPNCQTGTVSLHFLMKCGLHIRGKRWHSFTTLSPRVGQSLSSRTSMAACVLLPVTVTMDCTGVIKRL